LIIRGTFGSALVPATKEVTVYLEKPDRMKQESLASVILCSAERKIFNSGDRGGDLTGENLQEMEYRIGFYHNAFSLLKWEPFFHQAELLGLKDYGGMRLYLIRLPSAQKGHDLLVYIDADTFLVDRLAYILDTEEVGGLTMVNTLRDYQRFGGLLFPTRVVYDKVGWEVGPNHLVIRDIEIDPVIDGSVFESAEVDFGAVVVSGDRVEGEVRAVLDGSILTNVRPADLESINAQVTDWLDLSLGEMTLQVKLLDNIQASAALIKPEEIYLCRYPFSGWPRLMIMSMGQDVLQRIPCGPGDRFFVEKSEAPPAEPGVSGASENE